MKKMHYLKIIALAVASSISYGAAEGASCIDWQEHAAYSYHKVTSKRAYFLNDDLIKMKSYVVKGDIVAVRNHKPYGVCAVYVSKQGKITTGWLKADDIAVAETKISSPWQGEWEALFNKLSKHNKAWLTIDKNGNFAGDAIYTGMSAEAPSVGDIKMPSQLESNVRIAISDDTNPCIVQALRMGKYLLVGDNKECGGLNVTFSGVYRRAD